jgi:PilZ domain
MTGEIGKTQLPSDETAFATMSSDLLSERPIARDDVDFACAHSSRVLARKLSMSGHDQDVDAMHSEPPPPSASDRRVALRHQAFFPAEVNVGTGAKRAAMIRDLSVTGVLMLTIARVSIGDELLLHLYLTGDPNKPREVKGRVVRDERRSVEMSDMWPYAVAVQFDEPFPENELEDVRALAEKQARLTGAK